MKVPSFNNHNEGIMIFNYHVFFLFKQEAINKPYQI